MLRVLLILSTAGKLQRLEAVYKVGHALGEGVFIPVKNVILLHFIPD